MSDDTEDPDKLVREALMIEAEEALQAGAVGFIARALTQATMPHKATSDNEFTRQNGHFTPVSYTHLDVYKRQISP